MKSGHSRTYYIKYNAASSFIKLMQFCKASKDKIMCNLNQKLCATCIKASEKTEPQDIDEKQVFFRKFISKDSIVIFQSNFS